MLYTAYWVFCQTCDQLS